MGARRALGKRGQSLEHGVDDVVREVEAPRSLRAPAPAGALPGKEITGDAQEGEIPPRDYKQAPDDYFHQDTLDERLREEAPDRIRPDVEEVRLIDDTSEDGGGELRSERGDEGGYPSAEDAAMHVVDEAPGAVDRKIDSYTGDSTDELE